MGMRERVVEFFMITVYNLVLGYYAHVMCLVRMAKNPLPLQIRSATRNGEDVTQSYLKQKRFVQSLNDDDVIRVSYSFDDQNYSFYYTKDNPIEFPPHTFEQMRCAKPEKKIAAISVDGDNSVFETIKEYAGPLEDFYGREANLETILQRSVSKITLIDTKGQYSEIQGAILRFNS